MLNLGKMLFPNLPRDLRRRRMAVLVITALASVVFAGVMVFLLAKMGRPGGH
jgi:hypothetical protein